MSAVHPDETEYEKAIGLLARMPEDEAKGLFAGIASDYSKTKSDVEQAVELRRAEQASYLNATADIAAIRAAIEKAKSEPGALFSKEILEEFRLLAFDAQKDAVIWAEVKAKTTCLTKLKEAVKAYKKQWKNSQYEAPQTSSDGEGRSRIDIAIETLNKTYATIVVGGKSRIAVKIATGYEFWLVDAFHDYLAGEVVPVPGPNGVIKMVPISQIWAAHVGRNRFNGIEFVPGKENNSGGKLNLWSGFAVKQIDGLTLKRAARGCSLLLKHIRKNICQRDRAQFRYLIRYCAHMIQRPEDKPGVAISIAGEEGAGKSTLSVAMQSIFGVGIHSIKVAQASQLTGKFNEHLAYAILIASEEAFWAGDPQATGAIQDLITSDTLTVEPKGLGVITVPSYHRLISTSNKAWNFPATKNVRRLCALICGSEQLQNTTYFKALCDQLYGEGKRMHVPGQDSIGLRHFFTYLKLIDLKGFNVRKPPETEGLKQQRLGSLKSHEEFLYECLINRELATRDDNGRTTFVFGENEIRIKVGDFHKEYSAWCIANRKHRTSINQFSTFITETLGWKVNKPEGSEKRRWVILSWSSSRDSFQRVMKVNVEGEPDAPEPALPAPAHIKQADYGGGSFGSAADRDM